MKQDSIIRLTQLLRLLLGFKYTVQLTMYLTFLLHLLKLRMFSNSHSSLPLTPSCLGTSCCLSTIEPGNNTGNTGWICFIQKGNFSLYSDIDTFLHIAYGPSHWWSNFLLVIFVEIFLLLQQTWYPLLNCVEWLDPLINVCCIESCSVCFLEAFNQLVLDFYFSLFGVQLPG